MRPFVTLLVREWQEWRMVMAVVAAIYVLGLVVSTVALHRGSEAFLTGHIHAGVHHEHDLSDSDDFDDDPFPEEEDDAEWISPKEMGFFSLGEILRFSGRADLILFGWTHMLRGGVSFINLSLLVLALFSLADAVFKERADGSTYFYRSLPVGDGAVLAAKLIAGTVGFLGISFILGVGSVLFAQLTFPGGLAEYLAAEINTATGSPRRVISIALPCCARLMRRAKCWRASATETFVDAIVGPHRCTSRCTL